MTRIRTAVMLSLLLLSAFLALPALAGAPPYDAATETVLDGNVLYLADSGAGEGVFVILKDGNNEIQVFLAPSSFLSQEGLQLRLRDDIKVVGSRTRWNGTEVIVARQVTAGGKTVALRTPAGQPRW